MLFAKILFLLIIILIYAYFLDIIFKSNNEEKNRAVVIFGSLSLIWFFITGLLAKLEFYAVQEFPPRLILFVSFTILIIGLVFFTQLRDSIKKFSLRKLTLIQSVRFLLEIILIILFYQNSMPESITLEGRNFDILIGLSAPVIYYLTFVSERISFNWLTIWNSLGVLSIFNIISIGIQINVDYSTGVINDLAVLHFPYVWLPLFLVPLLLFCNLASIYIIRSKAEMTKLFV